jgi:hypothetical protein
MRLVLVWVTVDVTLCSTLDLSLLMLMVETYLLYARSDRRSPLRKSIKAGKQSQIGRQFSGRQARTRVSRVSPEAVKSVDNDGPQQHNRRYRTIF